MANSTTNIDTVVQSQASKEVTINDFFDAASPATVYGRRASATTGLTWGYYGGNVTVSAGTMIQIDNGTLTLTASSTCYIVALKSTGAVSFSTASTNWLNQADYWRLYSVVTGAATVTSYTDSRDFTQRLFVPSDGKTTPVDADYAIILDTEATSAPKRLTWSNIKATLKTYFDGLYALTGHNHSGTYEPADSTILKDADIGSTVQAYDADLTTWAGVTPGTGVATALAVNVGTAGSPVVNGGALGTPSSGTVTNLTGTASININGTVGATTPTTGVCTTFHSTSNLGVGAAASGSWGAAFRAVQFSSNGCVSAPYLNLLANAYNNGSAWKYIASDAFASRIDLNYNGAGGVNFFVAPSGNADDTISFVLAASLDTSGNFLPGADNTFNLGSASLGWKELFCDNGTINTSDARRKTEVLSLTKAEIEVAKALSKEIGTFQFLDAIKTKGDAARVHIGMTVQRAIEILQSHGLDPFAYSFICYDEWNDEFIEHPEIAPVEAKEAVLDKEGKEIEPAVKAVAAQAAWTEQVKVAGNKYSFRPHELLLFMARGFDARLSALETAP